jgi:hypothetical protein
MPKRLGSGDVSVCYKRTDLFLGFTEGQPHQISPSQWSHGHCSPSKKGTAHRYDAFHHSAVRSDAKGF